MAVDAEKLEQEADAEFAALMGQAPAQEPNAPAPADDAPPPVLPEAAVPATGSDNEWQDKYEKAEESRKNAHALMTQATQRTAELERTVQQMQQEFSALRAQPAPPPVAESNDDEFKDLREDYEELNPVFNKLDQEREHRQQMEQRLAAIEQAKQQQEQLAEHERFWSEVRKEHPDVDTLSQSDDFQGWFSRQTKDLQQMSQASPVGAAYVMTLYKQSGSISPQAARLQQAQVLAEPNVQGRSQPQTQGGLPQLTPQQIAALPQAEYEKNEAHYDAMLDQWMKQGGR